MKEEWIERTWEKKKEREFREGYGRRKTQQEERLRKTCQNCWEKRSHYSQNCWLCLSQFMA